MHTSFAAGLAILSTGLLAIAMPAKAQYIGTYNGKQANGQYYSVTVGMDTANNKPAVTSYGMGLSGITCKPGNKIGGIGFSAGTLSDIKNYKVTFNINIPTLYSKSTLTFNGDTVTGTVTSSQPNFGVYDGTKVPKKSEYCASGPQAVTATLGAPLEAKPATEPTITVR